MTDLLGAILVAVLAWGLLALHHDPPQRRMAPLVSAAERLNEIPGIGRIATAIIIAEVGAEMTRFPTAGRLASWPSSRPG